MMLEVAKAISRKLTSEWPEKNNLETGLDLFDVKCDLFGRVYLAGHEPSRAAPTFSLDHD